LRDCLVMANRGTMNSLRLMVFSAMQQGQKQKNQESLQLLKYVKKRDGR
jgi:hypothetical protein